MCECSACFWFSNTKVSNINFSIYLKLKLSDKGTHSGRKGGITLLLTGTPDIAPLIPTIIRSRWAVEAFQVILKYAKNSDAGDALIARMLSLLDPQSPEFLCIGPHFKETCDKEKVNQLVAQILGHLPTTELKKVGPWLVASLIYHWKYLRDTLSPTHSLWKTTFGEIDQNEIAMWQQQITTEKETGVQAKGIPISSIILAQNQKILELLNELKAFHEDAKNQMDDLARLIPLSAAGIALHAHQEEFKKFSAKLTANLQEGVRSVFKGLPQIQHQDVTCVEGKRKAIPSEGGFPLFHWGGKFRAVPPDFQFPNSKLIWGWEAWWGVSMTHMPLRAMVNGNYRQDLLDLCQEKRERKQRNTILHIYTTAMLFLEEHAEGQDLQELVKLTESGEKQSKSTEIREALSKVWNTAWESIHSKYNWHLHRKHDLRKGAIRTLYNHIKAEEKVPATRQENNNDDKASRAE